MASTNINNGLFSKVKKTMANGHSLASIGREHFDSTTKNIKQRLTRELESQFKDLSQEINTLKNKEQEHSQEQEDLKLALEQAQQQQQTSQVVQIISSPEPHIRSARLEEELQQTIGFYTELQRTKQEYEQLLKDTEIRLADEYNNKLLKQTESLAADYELKLNTNTFNKEQELINKYQQEFLDQKKIIEQTLHDKYSFEIEDKNKQIFDCNIKIEELKTELKNLQIEMQEAILATKAKVEADIDAKYEALAKLKIQEHCNIKDSEVEEYLENKNKEMASQIELKHSEIQKQLEEHKRILLDKVEQEKIIVLKYKEAELCKEHDEQILKIKAELEASNQHSLKLAIAAQQEQLQNEHTRLSEEFFVKRQEILALQEAKIQEAVEQERAKLQKQHANEKKLLLQQQQQVLLDQYRTDLEAKLAAQEKKLLDAHYVPESLVEEFNKKLALKQQQITEVLNREKELALEKQEKTLRDSFVVELSNRINTAQMQWENIKEKEFMQREQKLLAAKEREMGHKFAEILAQQRKQDQIEAIRNKEQELHQAIAKHEAEKLHQLEDQLKEQYALKLEETLEKRSLLLEQEYERKLSKIDNTQKEHYAQRLVQEQKKMNLKFAQEKAAFMQDFKAKIEYEKEMTLQKYETDLRDNLYREMVKQKEYIQAKFNSSQEQALTEQRRRLEALHKQEIERIKQGFFKNNVGEFSKTIVKTAHKAISSTHAPERGVEQLAERILAKFQGNVED